jgi:hypothetical protein
MHLVASWVEETSLFPSSSISSNYLKYLDNLLIVASGILESLNFITLSQNFGKYLLNSYRSVKLFKLAFGKILKRLKELVYQCLSIQVFIRQSFYQVQAELPHKPHPLL